MQSVSSTKRTICQLGKGYQPGKGGSGQRNAGLADLVRRCGELRSPNPGPEGRRSLGANCNGDCTEGTPPRPNRFALCFAAGNVTPSALIFPLKFKLKFKLISTSSTTSH